MAKKDYYQILGIKKEATEKEIKQAFRKAAKQWHPDANRDNPNAEARFKEINEAYEVLSDPDKRATYDRFGSVNPQDFASGMGGRPGGTYYTSTDAADSPFGDILEQIFGGFNRSGSTRGRSTSEQAYSRTVRADGQDIEQTVQINLREAYSGGTRIVTKGDRRLKVNIPAGATNGTRIRLAGEGAPGTGGGNPGDLYLIVEIEPDSQFEREGDNLKTEIKIDMFTAILGGEVEVPTLERPVKLRVPPGTQSGRRFRLTGKGMPIIKQSGQFGDLYARALVTVPENLTDQQREWITELRDKLR